ncbi:MAG: hypothetical protein AB7Q81_00775 [Gammaproteobacteria bacterium]
MPLHRPFLVALLVPGLAGVAAATAAPPLVSVEDLSGPGWTAHGLTVDVRWDAPGGPAVEATLARLVLPGAIGEMRDVGLRCAALALGADHIACADVRLHATYDEKPLAFAARFEFALGTRMATLEIAPFDFAGGTVDATLTLGDGAPAVRVGVHELALAELPALSLAGAPNCTAGGADGHLAWTPLAATLEVSVRGAACNDASGRHASEDLDASLNTSLQPVDGTWQGRMQLGLDAGGLYVEPVYLDLARYPLQVTGTFAYDAVTGAIGFDAFDIEQPGVLHARGDGLRWADGRLEALDVELDEVVFPAAYDAWAAGFLVGTSFATLDIGGAAGARLVIDDGAPRAFDLALDGLDIEDRQGRFAFYDVDGALHWAGAGDAVEGSTFSFGGGFLYGAGFAGASVELGIAGEAIDLLEPVRVPLLGGALVVTTFMLRDYGSDDLALGLEATLEPIDLGQLTLALDWPPFAGTLAGRLPLLSYQHGLVTVGGTLEASAFDGKVQVEGLRITNPLGLVPEIEADIRLRNLDLEQVTQVVPFGRVSGRLDGDIAGLHLLKGEPVAFDARFGTPPDDDSRHRLSQRAVDTIARVAGGGAVLSTTFLRVFEHFAYDKLGIACCLDNDICHMDGIAPAEDGYYIVKGALLPRVDLVGRVREVQWSRLIGQLKAALAEGEFRIE